MKQEMLDGEDTLQTMKMGDTRLMKRGHRHVIMNHMSPIGKYDYKKTDNFIYIVLHNFRTN